MPTWRWGSTTTAKPADRSWWSASRCCGPAPCGPASDGQAPTPPQDQQRHPGQSRWPVAYLLDVILNRDLWMHRVDLSRATGRPLVSGGHDQQIVAQVVRDLALGWSAAPVALELTGPAGGFWRLGSGDPVAVVRADAVAYLRALSGRDDDVVLELISGTRPHSPPSAWPASPPDRLVHAFAGSRS